MLFKRDRAIQSLSSQVPSDLHAPDTVRVFAVMVDFQTDTDPRTSGDGKFQLDANPRVIDPPPHDSAYFAYKLIFLENYFRKVSNDQLIVKGELFGRVISLSKQMANYSPSNSNDNKKLADLVIESWRTVDSLYPTIQFSRYDAFIVFHAGVGRDIDLVSLLGFNPTPNDIPSIFLNLNSMRSLLNDPAFPGIPVNGGRFFIKNTAIIPEIETRVIESGARRDTLQLSINGLLANSFGSYLGLPDLFNTKTGASGIGRFGLMDVASIFSYSGLFPPEPSAWEKVRLGWVNPIVVSKDAKNVSLPAVGLPSIAQDTIYKIPINDQEYFLMENRNRDPQRNGQRLTIVQNGSVVIRYFAKDTTGFRLDDVSAISGNLIDVEDFDWAIPGLIGENDVFEGGGILIWHIDEGVISRGIATNEVNANPNLRGVALEEADGSQDIGQSYDILAAGSGTELGWPLDCWFDGNSSPVYKNRFSEDTFPNSNSNVGARTLITIKDFSKRSPIMTATIEIGDSRFKPIETFNRVLNANGKITHVSVTNSGIFLGAGNQVFAFQRSGGSKTNSSDGLLSTKGGQLGIAALDDVRKSILVGAQDSILFIWQVQDVTGDGIYDSVQTIRVPLRKKITTPPVFATLSLKKSIVVGDELGSIWQIGFDGAIEKETKLSSAPVTTLTQLPTPNLSRPTQMFIASGGRLYNDQTSVFLSDSTSWIIAAGASSFGNFVVGAEKGRNRVLTYNSSLSTKFFDVNLPDASIFSLSVADVDGDGSKDIILLSSRNLYVINRVGALLSGFPVTLTDSPRFVGDPLVADIDGDGRLDIVCTTSDGRVVAYDNLGNPKAGFPLQATSGGEGFAALFLTVRNKIGEVALSNSGAMRAWELNTSYNPTTVVWPQHLRDAEHTNVDQSPVVSPKPGPPEFLPRSRVYNWPNPVYSTTTQIRYYVADDANVTIKVFDLAGLKITELNSRATGGIDNEITWDVSHIQSGIYFAHVEAVGNGKTESAVIKIAVVK